MVVQIQGLMAGRDIAQRPDARLHKRGQAQLSSRVPHDWILTSAVTYGVSLVLQGGCTS